MPENSEPVDPADKSDTQDVFVGLIEAITGVCVDATQLLGTITVREVIAAVADIPAATLVTALFLGES